MVFPHEGNCSIVLDIEFSAVSRQYGRVGNAFLPTTQATNGAQTIKPFAHPTNVCGGLLARL